MVQIVDTDPTVDQETFLTSALFAPSAPPLVSFPAGRFEPGTAVPPVLGFAPAPTLPAAPADRHAPQVRPRGRLHLGWYEIALILLTLSSAALCAYRLFWAIQP